MFSLLTGVCQQPDYLLDLAEFDTMEGEEAGEACQDTDLMAWLENISPIQR